MTSPVVEILLGCEWGKLVWTEDDKALCVQQAVKMLVVQNRDDGTEITVKVCQQHLERAERETDPHA